MIIVCATRGGEPSLRAQDRAIQLASQQKARLVFLHVVDMAFIRNTAAPILIDVDHELTRMGEFFLLMAQERAQEQGVEAEGVVRHGPIRSAIPEYLREIGADVLVLGRPHPRSRQAVFDEDEVFPFVQAIRAATGVDVVMV